MKKLILLLIAVVSFSGLGYSQIANQSRQKPIITWVKVPGEKVMTEIAKDATTGKIIAIQPYTIDQLKESLGQIEVEKAKILDLIAKADAVDATNTPKNDIKK